MKKKTALITGITGQDGTYLAEFLHAKGYSVFGMVTGQNNPLLPRTMRLLPFAKFVQGDLMDELSLMKVLEVCNPDEVYNLGAITFVPFSFEQPVLTINVNALGVARILESIRQINKDIKFFQASSAEMFGKVEETPQNEKTLFHPRSPYGVAKVCSYYLTGSYREAYKMFTCNGILFNHESSRRGHEFVTRKISSAVAKIKLGKQEKLVLGNLDSKRDWGFAGDYVEAMWLIMQNDKPDDYVISTGETHSVRELCELAFSEVGLNWKKYVEIDKALFRPAEVDYLLGDFTKAKRELHWCPKTTFEQLVRMMVQYDLKNEAEEDVRF